MKKLAALTLFLFVSASIKAQVADPTLPELSWLSGYWTSSENGTEAEELWTNGSGYMMLGIHRDVYANKSASFENLRIVQTKEGIFYIASPGGRPGTTFNMTIISDQKVVFENLENDFPQRIIYFRSGDTLTARIESEAGDKSMEWIWSKTNPKY